MRHSQRSARMRLSRLVLGVFWATFDYSTPKNLLVRSPVVGVAYRSTQLAILTYIVGYAIIFKKGYQSHDSVEFANTMKIKGIASTVNRNELPKEYRGIYDPSDYLLATHHNEAFFIMTNAIVTYMQSIGICGEDYNKEDARCDVDEDCEKGRRLPDGNGVQTGTCNDTIHLCMIHAWCPVEADRLIPELQERPLLEDAVNFTVFLETFVTFPKFNLKKTNVPNNKDLELCRFHPTKNQYCPVFRIGTIVEQALKYTNLTFFEYAILGGVIKITVTFNCDLDWSSEFCLPKYSFRQLATTTSIEGWNFRIAHEYRMSNNTLYRDLIKNYGILFLVSVEGTAGKFSWVPLTLKIGSGLGLLTLGRFVVDFLMLYVLPRRKVYKERMFDKIISKDIFLKENDDRLTVIEPFDAIQNAVPASQKDKTSNGKFTNRNLCSGNSAEAMDLEASSTTLISLALPKPTRLSQTAFS